MILPIEFWDIVCVCACLYHLTVNFYLCYRENSYQIFDQCWLSASNICVLPRILHWKLNSQCDCIRAHGLAGNWVLKWFSSALLWMRLVFMYMGSKRVLTFSLPSENAMRYQWSRTQEGAVTRTWPHWHTISTSSFQNCNGKIHSVRELHHLGNSFTAGQAIQDMGKCWSVFDYHSTFNELI